MDYSFQEIEEVLGPGSEHVILEQGVGSDGLYYVSYGTEDSTAIFYSPTEDGDTVESDALYQSLDSVCCK